MSRVLEICQEVRGRAVPSGGLLLEETHGDELEIVRDFQAVDAGGDWELVDVLVSD
jgi:hypothetical protein